MKRSDAGSRKSRPLHGAGFAGRRIHRENAPAARAARAELKHARLYSEELGINLASRADAELFKWFLAAALYGARISETIARQTYQAFVRHDLLDPKHILAAGWDFLVNPVMREGGYVRYDEKTSREVLHDCEMLLREYGGSLNRLHEQAADRRDLEQRLMRFDGVGPVTCNIFLRELRPYWKKSDPEPLPWVRQLARKLGVDLDRYPRKGLAFARIEAGLIRRRRELRSSN